MTRSSALPDYRVEDNQEHSSPGYEKNRGIRRVRRSDGTEAMGAMNDGGFDLLTYMYAVDPYFYEWSVYRLPCGTVYLMEEV